MKIYTSYFGNAKALAKNNIMIVSIACWQPRFLSIPYVMGNVAPTPWMVKKPPISSISTHISKSSQKLIPSSLSTLWST